MSNKQEKQTSHLSRQDTSKPEPKEEYLSLGEGIQDLNSRVEKLGEVIFTLNDKLTSLQVDSILLAMGETKVEANLSPLVYEVYALRRKIEYLTDVTHTIIRRVQI